MRLSLIKCWYIQKGHMLFNYLVNRSYYMGDFCCVVRKWIRKGISKWIIKIVGPNIAYVFLNVQVSPNLPRNPQKPTYLNTVEEHHVSMGICIRRVPFILWPTCQNVSHALSNWFSLFFSVSIIIFLLLTTTNVCLLFTSAF